MPIPTVLILKYVEQCYVQVVLNYNLVGCPCHFTVISAHLGLKDIYIAGLLNSWLLLTIIRRILCS